MFFYVYLCINTYVMNTNVMLFNKIQEIISDYSSRYPKVLVKIEGINSDTDYKLSITYSEDINEELHSDFFKSNGGGICIVTKVINLDNGSVKTDRTPVFKKHGWTDKDIDNYKNFVYRTSYWCKSL